MYKDLSEETQETIQNLIDKLDGLEIEDFRDWVKEAFTTIITATEDIFVSKDLQIQEPDIEEMQEFQNL